MRVRNQQSTFDILELKSHFKVKTFFDSETDGIRRFLLILSLSLSMLLLKFVKYINSLEALETNFETTAPKGRLSCHPGIM